MTLFVAYAPPAPVANPDSYTLDQGTTLDVPAPGVLGNDTDPSGELDNLVPGQLPRAMATSASTPTARSLTIRTRLPWYRLVRLLGHGRLRLIQLGGGDPDRQPGEPLTVANNDTYTLTGNGPLVVGGTTVSGNPTLQYGFDEASSGTRGPRRRGQSEG